MLMYFQQKSNKMENDCHTKYLGNFIKYIYATCMYIVTRRLPPCNIKLQNNLTVLQTSIDIEPYKYVKNI